MSEQSSTTPDSNDAEVAISAAEAVLTEHAASLSIAVPRWERLVRAMYSAGILDVVGRGWVTFDSDGFQFADLSHDQIEKLICILERYEVGGVRSSAHPGATELPLDLTPTPPTRPSTTLADTHHVGAAR